MVTFIDDCRQACVVTPACIGARGRRGDDTVP